MSDKTRTVIMEWTVQGHEMRSQTLETDKSAFELAGLLIHQHWPEGHNLPVHIEFFEIVEGKKVKTHSDDFRTRQFLQPAPIHRS